MGAGPTSINLPFTGIASFSKWPIVTNMGELDADVAVLGMPYDQSTQYRSGARFGPRGIRDGSTIYGFALGGAYDPERDEMFLDDRWRLVDCGDVDIVHGDQNQSHENLRHAVRTIVERGAMPVVLGGDHSITAPIVEAMASAGPFTVVQFDAHLDFVDERAGNRYGHGSPMRRISECAHVNGMAQLGIRGIGSSKRGDFEAARAYGSVILSVRDARRLGIEETLNRIPQSDRYYISMDADGLDPSIAPGNGSPSPGGFDYYEVQDLLEGITKKGRVAGFDFVEVAPMYDLTGTTSQVASRLILDLIGFELKERERTA
ncbi:MAG TPA: agmatinase [Thermomicrobiales bacterium]|nr:agmatinase [Thermomicrobiales bacterium]